MSGLVQANNVQTTKREEHKQTVAADELLELRLVVSGIQVEARRKSQGGGEP